MARSGKSPRRSSRRHNAPASGHKRPASRKLKKRARPVGQRSSQIGAEAAERALSYASPDSSWNESLGTERKSASILIIEDADPIRLLLRESLKGAGFQVVEARNGREGLELYQRNPTDMVITDLVMPEVGGQEVILELTWNTPPPKIIAITAESGDPAFLQVAEQFGACRTLTKPLSRKELVHTVQEVLREKRQYPRVEVDVPVAFSGDRAKGRGQLINLSMGGCTVESEIPVKSGQYLNLRLELPDRKSPVTVELAPVRWSTGQAFGLEFIRMKAEAQADVRHYLQSLCSWPTPAIQPAH